MGLRSGFLFLAAAAVVAAPAVLRGQADDRPIPTTIEQALIEHACSKPASLVLDPDKHEACLHATLDALRADFGRDLSRLPATERRGIDAACAPLRDSRGREGYLDCLSGRLAASHSRRTHARDAVAPAPPAAEAAAASPAGVVAPPPSGMAAISSRAWLAAALVTTLCAVAVVAVAVRARRARRICQVCGTPVALGDLCAACRHEAADTLRRATADRQRAHDDQERKQREHDEHERRRVAREAHDAQQREQEAARRRDQEAQRVEEEARRREAQAAAPPRQTAAAETPDVFDPHAILGVPPGAGPDAIQAAYEEAKAKYDPELVSGLGVEIQNHYLTKAEAVDRAFEMLAR